jgi:hypothetical protein
MQFSWKRLWTSFLVVVILLLFIKIYFCKYSLGYGTCVLEGMLHYFFAREVIVLAILTFMTYIIWQVFGKENISKNRTEFKDSTLNEKEAFHYSIVSFVLFIVVNLLALMGYLYIANVITREYVTGTEGLGFSILILIVTVSFLILFIISLFKAFLIKGTDYGKKSLILLGIITAIIIVDIILAVIVF